LSARSVRRIVPHALAIAKPIPLPGVLVTAVQALEEPKNLRRRMLFNPNPIINHGEYATSRLLIGCDMHARNLLAAVFYRVANQVLKQLGKPDLMDRNTGNAPAMIIAPASSMVPASFLRHWSGRR